MSQPVFEASAADGGKHLYYLIPDGWRHIVDVGDLNRRAVAGQVEPARTMHVGVGEGKPAGHENDPAAFDVIDDAWNAYPVLDGPLARP